MTIEELRAIAGYFSDYIRHPFDIYWVTTPLVEEAMANMLPIYKERLNIFIGVSRGKWKDLVLPKLGGGNMKPGYANACYALKRSLRDLATELSKLSYRALEAPIRKNQNLTCPHCGKEVLITVVITDV